jgi:hypothetical protein
MKLAQSPQRNTLLQCFHTMQHLRDLQNQYRRHCQSTGSEHPVDCQKAQFTGWHLQRSGRVAQRQDGGIACIHDIEADEAITTD